MSLLLFLLLHRLLPFFFLAATIFTLSLTFLIAERELCDIFSLAVEAAALAVDPKFSFPPLFAFFFVDAMLRRRSEFDDDAAPPLFPPM